MIQTPLYKTAIECQIPILTNGGVYVLENGDVAVKTSDTEIVAYAKLQPITGEYAWAVYDHKNLEQVEDKIRNYIYTHREVFKIYIENHTHIPSEYRNYIDWYLEVLYSPNEIKCITLVDSTLSYLSGTRFENYKITPSRYSLEINNVYFTTPEGSRLIARILYNTSIIIFDQDLWEEFWALLYEFQQNLVKFLQAVDPARYQEWSKS